MIAIPEHTTPTSMAHVPTLFITGGPPEEAMRAFSAFINNPERPKVSDPNRIMAFTMQDGSKRNIRVQQIKFIKSDQCWELIGQHVDERGSVVQTSSNDPEKLSSNFWITVRYFYYRPNDICGNWIQAQERKLPSLSEV